MSGRHRRKRAADPGRDQFEAAVSEAERGMERVAASMGLTVETQGNDSPDDPTMTALITRIREDVLGLRVRACPHANGSPQPLFLYAWDEPLVMRCLPCSMATPKPTGLADVTCDICGRVDPTGIWPAQVALGHIVVNLGRCDDCIPDKQRNAHRRRP